LFSLSVSDGEYLIDKNSNTVIFTFEPSVDLGVIGRIGDKFLEKGLVFFDFFNSYLDNSLPKNLINISGNWRVYNDRLEGVNGTAYYFIDKNLNGFYAASNFGSDNNLGQIFVSPVNLSGLVLYLTFDEGSGNIVYDYSGNGNNGILYNGSNVCSNPPNSGCPTWVDGKFGKALSFDGVNDYVEIPDAPSLQITSAITISAWLKFPVGVASGKGVVQKYPVQDYDYMLYLSVAGYPSIYIKNPEGRPFSTAYLIDHRDNNWHHWVGTFDGRYLKIYVDGILRNTADTGGTTIRVTSGQSLHIMHGWSGYLNGTIDEVLIYNRALSEEEIRFLYQEGLKKLQNSGMIQFSSQIKPYIAISNPSGKIYVENLRVGNQNSKEIKLIKPFYDLEFDSSFRFSKGNHQIKIENIGFNSTSKRPIIRISES
jgi:hypothetical protein